MAFGPCRKTDASAGWSVGTMRPHVLLLAVVLLAGGLAFVPSAPAHGCVSGQAGPPCSAPFCPDNGGPHWHPAPQGLRNSICLWTIGIDLLP